MYDLVRKVVARYITDPGSERQDPGDSDWMTYMQSKSEDLPVPEHVLKMFQGTKKKPHSDIPTPLSKVVSTPQLSEDTFETYNPYEKETPNESPKDMGDSPPFSNRQPYEPFTESGIITRPSNYNKQTGPLKEWWMSRREDYTADPTQQNPAISADRKYAALASYLLEEMPLNIAETDLPLLQGAYTKEAASLDEVMSKDTHYKNTSKIQKARRCSVGWTNRANKEEIDSGRFIFRVQDPNSSTKKSEEEELGPRIVTFQFTRDPNQEGLIKKYTDYPVKIACTCPAFIYFGSQKYAIQDGYLLDEGMRINPGANLPPHPENTVVSIRPMKKYPGKMKRHMGRGLNCRVCKHILAAYLFLQRMPDIRVHHIHPPTNLPSSPVINKDVWKQHMKFDFTLENIKRNLTAPVPKIPAYLNKYFFNKPEVIEWFKQDWMPSSEDEKLKKLRDMVESPESIYLYLMMDADYRRRYNLPKLSDSFIEQAYDMMALTVKPEAEPSPVQTEMPGVPEQEKMVGKGTLIPLMGRDPTPEDMEEEPVQGEALEELPEPGKAPAWKPTAPTAPTAPGAPKPVESPLSKKEQLLTPEEKRKRRQRTQNVLRKYDRSKRPSTEEDMTNDNI